MHSIEVILVFKWWKCPPYISWITIYTFSLSNFKTSAPGLSQTLIGKIVTA